MAAPDKARRNPTMFNDNRLKLGVFAANCLSGTAVTTVPERWDPSWENNVALARLADRAGIEFMLPIGRWIGYGGKDNFHGATFETITWASGLLANTENITAFGTVHAPLIHPVVAAKQMVTVDHISGGRFGLNIVCGWNQDEFEAFGIDQRGHEERYAYGQEWWDVIRRLWEDPEPFDFDGRYLKLKKVRAWPKPYGGRRPIVLSAGASTVGRRFAARNGDVLFTNLIDHDRARAELPQIRAMAAEFDRTVGIYTSVHVVCRPTAKEAEDFHRYYAIDNADEVGVARLMELQNLHATTYPEGMIGQLRDRFAGGHGSYPVIGDPDHVAQEFARIGESGFDGTTLTVVNYLDELPYFIQEVLPRLERMGWRQPVKG